jgi:hypothetical protein
VARNAVRASREAHRAWQEAQSQPAADSRRGPAPQAEGVVTEWMIAAAALGEAFDELATPAETAAGAEAPTEASGQEAAADVPPPVWTRGSPETGGAIPVAEIFSPVTRSWTVAAAPAPAQEAGARTVEKPALPPGHFRATPEMLSLIGCGEAEMTIILRALDYRVHQPPDNAEGPTTFSMRPRFQRERDDRRDQERRGPRPDWKRRRRTDDQGPTEGRDGRPPRRGRRHDAPPAADGAPVPADAGASPANEDRRPPRRDQHQGPREDRRDRPPGGGKFSGPRTDGERRSGGGGEQRGGERRGGGGFGPRRDRDREAGPEVRLVASTEKKGDRTASDSPFAKLLELKLGKQ